MKITDAIILSKRASFPHLLTCCQPHISQAGDLHAASILRNLCDGEVCRLVVDAGGIELLLDMITENDTKLIIPAVWTLSNLLMVASVLRVFGCVAMGSNRQTEALLNDKVLPIFGFLLKFPGSETILHDLRWILSNIATGPVAHKATLLQTNMLPKIIELSRTENLALKKQVISIIRKLAWKETDNTDSTKESFPLSGLDIRVDILILKALNRFSTQGGNKKFIVLMLWF
jgi:hypothetical protein